MSIQQGYLQYSSTGSEQALKVFVTVSNQEIIVYPEDPSKFDQLPTPLARFNSQKIQLVDSGDFHRPKSFGVISDRGQLIEFSCPTNSVRASWVKSIREIVKDSNNHNNSQLLKSKTPNMDIYRTPVSTVRIPAASTNNAASNRFSDFDGFANHALSHLNSLKADLPPSSHPGPSAARSPIAVYPSGVPAIRVVQPTVSKVFGGTSSALSSSHPPPPSHNNNSNNYNTNIPNNNSNGVLVQPVVRKVTPKTQSAPKPSSQQPPKPLPQWVPGHFKTTTLVSHPKNTSPQRARRDQHYNVQQPLPQPSQQQTSLLHAHNGSLPPQNQFYPPPQHQQNGSLPIEKMTLEQLREAFQNMPSEVRSAIVEPPLPQQNNHSNHSRRQSRHEASDDLEYHHDNHHHRYPSQSSRREKPDYYESEGERRSHHHPHHHQQSREEEEYYSEAEQRRRPRSRRSREDVSNRRGDPRREEESSDRYEESEEEVRRISRSDDDILDNAYYGDSHRHRHQNDEEDYYVPPERSTSRRNIAARLDYTDFSEPEPEVEAENQNHHSPAYPQELQFSSYHQRSEDNNNNEENLPRYMRSKSRERKPPPPPHNNNTNNRNNNRNHLSRAASNPRGPLTTTITTSNSNKKPAPLERSRSAPPPGVSSPSGRDFSTKTRSVVPRGDLLEWSKKQAYQKHIATGYPMSKAQEKAVKESYKSPPTTATAAAKTSNSNNRLKEHRSPSEPPPTGSGGNRSQRIRAVEEQVWRRGSVMSANNGPAAATAKATTGSFFDFMRSRGAAPVPQLSAVPPVTKEESREELQKTKAMNYQTQPQLGASLPKTKPLQYPSGTSHSKLSPGLQRKIATANSPDKPHHQVRPHPVRPGPPPLPQQRPVNKAGGGDREDHSIVSGSTLSMVKLERSLSHQNMLQSNSTTPLTDVAEWQRVTNWLTSFRMEKYIPTFREHGITKLSLIELLAEEDFWELGIEASDIPVIKLRVAEFSQRIKTFAEEAVFEAIPSKRERKGRGGGIPPTSSQEEEEDRLRSNNKARSRRKKAAAATKPPQEIHDLDSFQVSLLLDFDRGDYSSFFSQWESFVYYFTPSLPSNNNNSTSNNTSNSERPALYFAKQAMEFHLYVYFYVYSIRKKGGEKEVVSTTKQALKNYLENLAEQYETFHPLLEEKYYSLGQPLPPPPNSANVTTTANTNTNTNTDNTNQAVVVLDDSMVLPVEEVETAGAGGGGNSSFSQHHQNNNPTAVTPSTPPKPLITSREFATFAGLVFVPNPQYNPAFQTLFTEDWSLALRQRLSQFVAIIVEERKKKRVIPEPAPPQPILLPVASSSTAEDPSSSSHQEKLSQTKRSLSLTRPAEEAEAVVVEKEITDAVKAGMEKLILQTAEISPIRATPPPPPPATTTAADHHELRPTNITVDVTATSRLVHAAQAHRSSHQPHQGSSFPRPPPESPLSNGSTISQLTDDTPVKAEQLRRQQPSNRQSSQPMNFTFSKLSNSALAEAANRAGVKLKTLQQGVPAPVAVAVTGTGGVPNHKPRMVNPSPPKASSSLQSQVDQYNKLLKQHRLSKTSGSSGNPPPPVVSDPNNNHNSHPVVTRTTSTELQQQSHQLLQEMKDPLNQDLIHQIDAIIAPLNQAIVVPPLAIITTPEQTITTAAPAMTAAVPRGFNLGLNLPRVAVPGLALPVTLTDPTSLNSQVNKYKNLLKGKSSNSSFEAKKEKEKEKEEEMSGDDLQAIVNQMNQTEEGEQKKEEEEVPKEPTKEVVASETTMTANKEDENIVIEEQQQPPFLDISSEPERDNSSHLSHSKREEEEIPDPSAIPTESIVEVKQKIEETVETVKEKEPEIITNAEPPVEDLLKASVIDEGGEEEEEEEGIDEVNHVNTTISSSHNNSNHNKTTSAKKKKKKKKTTKKET